MAAHLLRWAIAAAALVALATSAASGDDQLAKDKQECAPQLVGLAPCLAYVGGNAKAPTMDCCTNLKQVLLNGKKCLCLLVKDRDQPGLGVKIDADLALGLPAACHAVSNISDCPALLHLAANSPDAKVFTDFAKGHNATTSATTSAPATATPTSTSSNSTASDGGSPKNRALAVLYGILVVVACFFLLSAWPI